MMFNNFKHAEKQYSKSRTAMIALLASGLYFLFTTQYPGFQKFISTKGYKLSSILIVFALILLGSYLAIQLKPNSYFGRIFVWKVSLSHLSDHLFFGVGLGNFAYYYPEWQIQYLRDNENLQWKYLLNADETHVANNEYIQILAETGLTGFLAFSFFMGSLLGVKPTENNKELIFPVKLTLVTILTASFSSYSLHCNPVIFVFIFCLAILSSSHSGSQLHLKRLLPLQFHAFLLFQILIIASLFQAIQKCDYVSQWTKLSNDVGLPASSIKSQYQLLYPALKTNGKFLVDYGEHLLSVNEPTMAALILEESKKYYLSYRTYLSAADAYYQIHDLPAAIDNLEQLSRLVPYKFYPRYQLVKLHYLAGDTVKGKMIAEKLLSMPVKVMSPEVMDYRQEVMEILHKENCSLKRQ